MTRVFDQGLSIYAGRLVHFRIPEDPKPVCGAAYVGDVVTRVYLELPNCSACRKTAVYRATLIHCYFDNLLRDIHIHHLDF